MNTTRGILLALSALKPGEELTATVLRAGKLIELKGVVP